MNLLSGWLRLSFRWLSSEALGTELTRQEQRMVQRLRKQERQWRWARWLMLFGGIFNAAAVVAMWSMVVPRIQSESEDMAGAAFVMAIFFPVVLVISGNATLALCLAIRDWHGNTTRTLLLKLLENCRKQN